MLPPLIHIVCSSLLFFQTYIEEPPPAAIVCHPRPQTSGAIRYHLYLIVVYGVVFGLPPCPREMFAVKEPPLI